MNLFDVVGIALFVSMAALLLSMMGYSGWRLVAVVGIVAMYLYLVGVVGDMLDSVTSLVGRFGIGEVADAAVRLLGVSYVFGVASDMTRAMGQMEVASALEVVGRVEILAISMPYLFKIIETVIGYIKVE